MGIKGHQRCISLATEQTWVLSNQYITSYGTDMGIKGHQISISLATVQIWVLKDTKAVH